MAYFLGHPVVSVFLFQGRKTADVTVNLMTTGQPENLQEAP